MVLDTAMFVGSSILFEWACTYRIELVSEIRRGTEVYTVRRLWERSREDAASRDGPRADMDVAADA